MKRFFLLCIGFMLCGFSAWAQFDKWQIYHAYQNTEQVAETPNWVFALADSSLYAYGKEDRTLTTYSRKNGLSDNKIKVIRYHASSRTLVIAYRNGNIDLLNDDGFYNLPFLKNSTTVQNKMINDIYFYEDYAYLPAEVGIVVVNLKKKEIADTYKIGSVHSVAIMNGAIYALTSNGILQGKLSDNLLDSNNWSNYSLSTDQFEVANVGKIVAFKGALCFSVSRNGVYYQKDNQVKRLLADAALTGIKVENDKLLAFAASKLYVASSLENAQPLTVSGASIKDATCLKSDDCYWLACGSGGLKGVVKQSGSYRLAVDSLSINSPKRNYAWDLQFVNNKLWVTGGGRWLNRYSRTNTIMTYENGIWTNFNEQKIAKQANANYIQDAMNVAVDPKSGTYLCSILW